MVIFVMLIVALLPHAVCDAQNANCKMWDPLFVHQKYYQPGDLIIGGIVFQNMFLTDETTFNQNLPHPLLDSTYIQNYQHVLALEFAVKEINENQYLLPNLTLGFNIYDSYLEARGTYRAALHLISPKDKFVPNYQCDIQDNLMAVIEELTSDITHEVPEVLGSYKIPQLLYGSAAVTMDKNQALSVYRVEPNGVHQYRGILQILLHFKWTWIGFIAADGMHLQWFMEVMFQEFSKHGICFAILETFSSLANEKSAMEFHDKIMKHNVNVSVFYGDIRSMQILRLLLSIGRKSINQKPKGKVWILTAQMESKCSASYRDWNIQEFHGSLSFATHSHELQGFQDFIQSRNLSNNKDGFLKNFWENAFQCTFSSSLLGNTGRTTCSGEEMLENLPQSIFPVNITGQSYTVYNAVYSVAQALHAMYASKSKNRRKVEGKRKEFQNQQPWQLHHFLKMVSFNNSVGDQISFDQNGELIAGFDIMNWIIFPNQSLVEVKVGRLDPWTTLDETITISEAAIVWHNWLNKEQPHSACNDNCSPGYRKRNKEGKSFCCYDCIPCPEGKVSDQKDMADCFTCPSDRYPSKNQTSCVPKVVVFLSYEEPLGIAFAICALLLSLVTALVLRLFVKHHNSPVVKVNNRSLSYTILVSLLLSFLCPLMYLGRPEKIKCMLCQTIFAIVYSIAISSLLAKTVTVVLAFTATRPGTIMKSCVGKRLALFIILPCSVIEIGICIVGLVIFPPFPEVDMHSHTEEIILKCSLSPAIVYCETAFFGLLAFVSTTAAFFAQKLPDAFNEAQFITFSMIAYCSAWMAFNLTNMSPLRKTTVAVEIFSILASGAAVLFFMFFPKCYVILWRPQLNSREQLRKLKC